MAVSLTLVFGDAGEREGWMDEHGFRESSSDDTSVILVVNAEDDLDRLMRDDEVEPDAGELDPATQHAIWRSWCAGS